jgi:hypothetical protein
MNGPSGINPWPNVNTTQPAPKSRPVAPAEVQERLLLARLFGQKDQPVQQAQQPEQKPNNDDEFAPNLGRNLDVIA